MLLKLRCETRKNDNENLNTNKGPAMLNQQTRKAAFLSSVLAFYVLCCYFIQSFNYIMSKKQLNAI